MRYLFAIMAVTLSLSSGPARADRLVQVIVDHSGILHDEQDPEGKTNLTNYILVFLDALARKYRRDRDSTHIRIISAVEPPSVIWAGSAADFYRSGLESERVKALSAKRPNGCNNLTAALEEASVNLKISNSAEKVLYIITSGVHSGPGCQRLTQNDYENIVANTDLDLVRQIEKTAGRVNQLSVYFLTATQRRAFFNELQKLNPNVKNVALFPQGEGLKL